MAAAGQLTAGIAHEIKNMLGPVDVKGIPALPLGCFLDAGQEVTLFSVPSG